MKRLVNWIANHIVLSWALVSVAFAIIIHLCYSTPAPYEWLVAKWEAGDVLSYASSISLGLLAIWQNQKFKTESDRAQDLMDQQNTQAQERLERINIESNELNLITRIVDHESTYIVHLDELVHGFFQVCETNKLHDTIMQAHSDDGRLLLSAMENQIIHTYSQLSHFLSSGMSVSGLNTGDVEDNCRELYRFTLNIIQAFHQTHCTHADYAKHQECYKNTVAKTNSYLLDRRKILYRTMTEKMNATEVRSIYGS